MNTITPSFHLLTFLDPQAILQIPANNYTYMIYFLIGVAMICLLCGLAPLRRARRIIETPTSKIMSATQGFVELEGIQKNIENHPIYSPLSKTLCTWYSYSIENIVRRGKSTYRNTIESGTSQSLFRMTDFTGDCVIDPAQATVLGGYTRSWYGSERKGCAYTPFKSWFFPSPYRYTESLFKPEDPLYAMGMLHSINPLMTGDPNIDIEDLVNTWKKNYQAQLKNLDNNNTQQSNPTKQEATVKMPKAGALRLLSSEGCSTRPYILSKIPQTQLIKKYRYEAAAFYITALLLTVIVIDLLSVRTL